jgi:hypothetical protein
MAFSAWPEKMLGAAPAPSPTLVEAFVFVTKHGTNLVWRI